MKTKAGINFRTALLLTGVWLLTGASPITMQSFLISAHAADGLQQLKYNNPGLVTDLGVGLWAWPVPCDADGDGDYDLIVSCPDKPSNGVWLFENATGDTAKNNLPIFKPARRLSATRHYVMPSYVNGHVNGKLRVLTPGQEYADFIKAGLQHPQPLSVAANFYQPEGKQTKGPKVRHNQWRYVDYDGDGALDLITGIEDWSWYGWDDAWNVKGEWQNGPLHGFVLWHRNTATNDAPSYASPVKLEADGKPIDVFGCPSPNFEDFDGDGDLDLLCGEFLDGFTYFENTGTRTQPHYAAGRRLKDARGNPLTMDLQMIVSVAFDWDKDGDHDLIVGDEDGRVAFVENTGKRDKTNTPVFARPRYFQQEADALKFGALATPVGFDWDGDGDTDIVSGNTAGYVGFFENLSGANVEKPKWAAPKYLKAAGQIIRPMAGANGSIQGPAEAKWGYTTLSIADWDGDKLPDLIVNSIWGKVVWYRNTGTRKAPQLAAAQPIEVEWQSEQPALAYGWLRPQGKALLTQWRTTPVAVDWNKDGLIDLLMLDQAGYLAFFERAKRDGKMILLAPRRAFHGENFSVTNSRHNISNASAGLMQLNSGLAGASGRRKLCVVDWDGDGLLDLFVNSANANFLRQTAARDSVWHFKDMGLLVNENIEGHDVSPTTVDFNGDGLPDFLGGAEDGRMYYLRNPKS